MLTQKILKSLKKKTFLIYTYIFKKNIFRTLQSETGRNLKTEQNITVSSTGVTLIYELIVGSCFG